MLEDFITAFGPDAPPAAAWLVALWLFAVGAAIGSFLNVVVYRLPAGMSLVRPASRCPACKAAIPPWDNIPIFGWLILRGRCRNCAAPISLRYPLVELATALVFLLLAWLEPLSGGINLPPPSSKPASFDWPSGLLWGIYAYHLLLFCALGADALIESDGHAAPRRLLLGLLAAGLLAGCLWPELRPVQNVLGGPSTSAARSWQMALAEGMAGAAAGWLLGWLAGLGAGHPQQWHSRPRLWTTRNSGTAALPASGGRQPPERGPSTTVAQPPWGVAALRRHPPWQWDSRAAILACAGTFLGWQAAAGLAMLTSALHLAASPLRLYMRTPNWTGWLALATLGWIAAWRPIVQLLSRVDAPAAWLLVLAAAVTILLGWLEARTRPDSPPRDR